jgi:hypothetical protein
MFNIVLPVVHLSKYYDDTYVIIKNMHEYCR